MFFLFAIEWTGGFITEVVLSGRIDLSYSDMRMIIARCLNCEISAAETVQSLAIIDDRHSQLLLKELACASGKGY